MVLVAGKESTVEKSCSKESSVHKRSFNSWYLALSSAFFLSVTAGHSSAQKSEKLHVGYSAQAGSLAPIWITKEAGIFKKHGLDVELLFIPGGPTAAAALMSGEVPITVVGGPAVVSSNLAGSDLVMIAGIVNTFAFQIVSVKTVTSYQQLKGKRLGVNRFGASPDVAARFALKHMGIDLKDITILQLGEQSTRLTAMMAGQLESGGIFAADHYHGTEEGHERAPGSRGIRSGVSDHRIGQQPEISIATKAHGYQVYASFRRRHPLLQVAQA